MQPFLGQIQPFGFNFAPRGWALCDGQLMSINANQALFSLLGTTFGGDGRSTFGLPDLRGRSMVHVGTGPGLSSIRWGERSGNEYTQLTIANMPSHNHTANIVAEGTAPSTSNPQGNMLAGHQAYTPPNAANNKNMSTGSIAVANNGGSLEFSNRSPLLGVYIGIATTGTFPSRN